MDASAKKQLQAGKRLTAEKNFCVATGQTWSTYVKQNCGISRRRADELIRINAGQLTVEESRSRKLRSQRKTRALRQNRGAEIVERHLQQAKVIEQNIRRWLEVENFPRSTIRVIKKSARQNIMLWQGLLRDL